MYTNNRRGGGRSKRYYLRHTLYFPLNTKINEEKKLLIFSPCTLIFQLLLEAVNELDLLEIKKNTCVLQHANLIIM